MEKKYKAVEEIFCADFIVDDAEAMALFIGKMVMFESIVDKANDSGRNFRLKLEYIEEDIQE